MKYSKNLHPNMHQKHWNFAATGPAELRFLGLTALPTGATSLLKWWEKNGGNKRLEIPGASMKNGKCIKHWSKQT